MLASSTPTGAPAAASKSTRTPWPLTERIGAIPRTSAELEGLGLACAGTSPAVVAVGDTVMHAKFGKGKVVNLEGSAPNEKATVFFPSVGQKQLLLKFAKLEVVG